MKAILKVILVLIFTVFTVSCKTTSSIQSLQEVEKLAKQIKKSPSDISTIHKQVKITEHAIKHDINSTASLFALLKEVIDQHWGKENRELPRNKKYVKYSNNYQARAIVDFVQGTVTVETIAKTEPLSILTQAITTTLLTTADPSKTDIFSSDAPQLGGEPFLFNQVLDQDKKAIRYQWRANRFAQYLVKSHKQRYKAGGKDIHAVSFPLVTQHKKLRKEKYSQYVLASARKYQISPSLIYGVIETESSFNPYAVSSANAYGLMQVVPSTAGKDVYQRVKNKPGQPSKNTLFNPKDNIDIGTAYISILQNNYLTKISNKQSQHFAIISAYNGGAGNVLKTFHHQRERAFSVINQKSSGNVYYQLINNHPRAESRQYLEKVVKAEKRYQ